ncbi:hypothetical protein WR25_11428 [Diploscapter pachys]|uniref:Bacterial type II secretion system protein E domain-containing protein n=1 Tax=Diploscapter pachys TaxID=2018661 RepID=A0A2A2KJN5_9BILA|nr:hypothetical protein WR25_11428 [Diploscapter pachys]
MGVELHFGEDLRVQPYLLAVQQRHLAANHPLLSQALNAPPASAILANHSEKMPRLTCKNFSTFAETQHERTRTAPQLAPPRRLGRQHCPLHCALPPAGRRRTGQPVSHRVGQPFLAIDPLQVDLVRVAGLMSAAFAQRHGILAVAVDEHSVTVASAQPYQREWEADLSRSLGKAVRRVLASPRQLRQLRPTFLGLAHSVRGAGLGQLPRLGELEQLLELGARQTQASADDAHIHLGRMNVAEKRRPQDGRLKTRLPSGAEVELRLSTLPTPFGEKLVLRLSDPQQLHDSLETLGLEGALLEQWLALLQQRQGILLVTGPTGSGKTSTLYASLRHLASPQVNLCSIEDPIERLEPMINQLQDACGAITRLLELGVADYLIRATLLGVMAQRLVRTLCRACLELRPQDRQACRQCRGTGFHGRTGLFELLQVSTALRERITPASDLAALRQQAKVDGLRDLRRHGGERVAQGRTCTEEVLRVCG